MPLVVALLTILLLFSLGCSSQPTDSTAGSMQQQTHQIIVGLDGANANPEDAALITAMAKVIGAEPQFIRRMSGNAAIYRVSSSQTAEQLSTKLQQLRLHDSIRYAELDQRQTIQQQ